jgi:hypothetical protein
MNVTFVGAHFRDSMWGYTHKFCSKPAQPINYVIFKLDAGIDR